MVFGLSFLCTCVSVRRRDRCTRTPPIHFLSFLPSCFAARPSSPCFLFGLLLAFTLVKRTSLCTCIVCAALLSLWWSCVSLHVLPCGARGIVSVFVFLLFSPRRLSGFVALLAVLVWALLFPLLSALLCCGSFLCPVCLPSPAKMVLFGALVQLAPWCAGTSLWVSGCSCDGLVALLSCWECGLSFAILPSFVSWQQRLLALCGVFTLYTMSLVTSGSLVWPY